MSGAVSRARWRALAPAKVNLGLFVGPLRTDGRHELVTVVQSISLADEVWLEPAAKGAVADEVVCPGVEGPNLAGEALAAFRIEAGWDGPPVRVRIDKRVPVAAGLGGGSGDAAAALRLAAAAAGRGDGALVDVAARLGADVPAQVSPGRWLAGGAGERLEALPAPAARLAVLVLPLAASLSTAAVYAEADRLRLARGTVELAAAHRGLAGALAGGAALPPADLLVNDLQDAARSLCPDVDDALAEARRVGADVALVSGSGPTVLGLFAGGDAAARAEHARDQLAGRQPAAVVAEPVGAGFGHPVDARVRHN